jgi:hypothetical protein
VRVLRALEQLGESFDSHVRFLEGPDGPLAEIAPPHLLPFSPEAERVKNLRGGCQRLRPQIRAVTIQFRSALLLFPHDTADPADAIADAQAFRLYTVLRSCTADLLKAIEEWRAEEASLLAGTPDPLVTFETKAAATSGESAEALGTFER